MADTPGTRSYHWIITLCWGPARIERTGNGVTDVPAGMSRQELYKQILAEAQEEMGAPEAVAVVFFALEPNELS